MRSLFALVLSGVAAMASPIVMSEDQVHVATVQGNDGSKLVEVDMADSVLNEDGLLTKTSVSFVVTVEEGVAIVNDQYALPVGIASFQVATTIQEYEVSEDGIRAASQQEAQPVAIQVASSVDFDLEGHMHLQLQVVEAEGFELEDQRFTAIEIYLDDDMNEAMRIQISDGVAPIAEEDMESAQDVEAVDFTDGGCVAMKRLVTWWNKQTIETRVGVCIAAAGSLAIILTMLTCLCHCCLCAPKRKQQNKKATKPFMKMKSVAVPNARVFIPMKQYKYTKLQKV